MRFLLFLPFLLGFSCTTLIAQKNILPELKFNLNTEGSAFVKFNFSNQIWLRYTELNPGSTLDDYEQKNSFDIGLRRTRVQVTAKANRILLYMHMGQNNLSFNASRKQGIFFHDALGEIEFIKDKFYLGAGLTSWGAYSRYSAASTTSALSLDVPIYQFSTLDASDQFLRKMAIYAKGLIGNLNYRIAIAKPMSFSNATLSKDISEVSNFSLKPSHLQFQTYLMYHFLETESNASAYLPGSYLGKKRVLNLGIGFLSQKDAMWRTINMGQDTTYESLKIYNIDAFFDYALNREKETNISAYLSYSYSDFGKNYVRNIGVMNPSTGTTALSSFNGAGNAFPMIGTGHNIMLQLGYSFQKDLFKSWGTLQPYFSMQYSKFERLQNPSITYDLGINWLIIGHKAKISFNYQNRGIFIEASPNHIQQTQRKGMFVTQFQIAI